MGINSVERFVGDEDRAGVAVKVEPSSSGKRVLVVGAGPSGLSAAYFLARLGHAVTIRDAGPMAGGMMRFGSRSTGCRARCSTPRWGASSISAWDWS